MKPLLEKIEEEIKALDPRDGEAHIWWGRFREFVKEHAFGVWAEQYFTSGHSKSIGHRYKDKNGLDIYDGDTLKLGFAEASGEAKYENGTFWIYHLGIKRHISDYEQSGIQVIKSNIIK